VKLLKELWQPSGLGDTFGYRVILSFSTRSGDGFLTLGRLEMRLLLRNTA